MENLGLFKGLPDLKLTGGPAFGLVSGESEKPETYTRAGRSIRPYTERTNPLEDHLGGSPGTNAPNPRQLPVQAVQLLDWAQESGWLNIAHH
jgi:hypothetical protein